MLDENVSDAGLAAEKEIWCISKNVIDSLIAEKKTEAFTLTRCKIMVRISTWCKMYCFLGVRCIVSETFPRGKVQNKCSGFTKIYSCDII